MRRTSVNRFSITIDRRGWPSEERLIGRIGVFLICWFHFSRLFVNCCRTLKYYETEDDIIVIAEPVTKIAKPSGPSWMGNTFRECRSHQPEHKVSGGWAECCGNRAASNRKRGSTARDEETSAHVVAPNIIPNKLNYSEKRIIVDERFAFYKSTNRKANISIISM